MCCIKMMVWAVEVAFACCMWFKHVYKSCRCFWSKSEMLTSSNSFFVSCSDLTVYYVHFNVKSLYTVFTCVHFFLPGNKACAIHEIFHKYECHSNVEVETIMEHTQLACILQNMKSKHYCFASWQNLQVDFKIWYL